MSCQNVAFIAVFALIAATSSARGDVKLPSVIDDHMVLQMGREIPFWGWAEPSEEISVTITSKEKDAGENQKPETASIVTAADGRWLVKLPARNKPGVVEITIAGKNTLTLT
ncbi:MAG: sialate O-acetylesterase, partial [Schlesneria sp.]